MEKNGNIGVEMVDERKKSKPMKVKKYEDFRVFKPFSSPFSCIFIGLFCEPSKMGIVRAKK